MLEIQSLTKSFGGVTSLDDCNFSVQQGKITGLIGPNGAGKTTLFNVIAGAIPPSSGQIIFQGNDITGLSADSLFHKGIVRSFQIPHEFQQMSVLENLMIVPSHQSGENLLKSFFRWAKVQAEDQAIRHQAEAVLAKLKLSHLRDEKASNLSGGQKKLLELGRTMMTQAKLVLLDEPAAGVNKTLLKQLAAQITALNQKWGYSFIIIEHDMDLVAKLCDPVICLAQGKVLVEGSFQKVSSDERVREAYLGTRS